MAQKATEFGELKQNKGHYAVRRQLRSPILVQICVFTCDSRIGTKVCKGVV